MSVEVRQQLHEALQATAASDDNLEGAVLVGWVTVAEWMDGSGERWLSCMAAPADPSRNMPVWQREGYLTNALNPDGWEYEIEVELEEDDD